MGIRIERVKVYNIVGAVYSARNAMNSWAKSDSDWETDTLGKADLALAMKLSKAGNDHAKYLRMINVTMDVTAPLYWWKEADTYAVGVVKNSCSTMHKIHAKEFVLDDFSHERLRVASRNALLQIIEVLNIERRAFIGEDNPELKGDKQCWYSMIQLLPSSYNQKRTVLLNYQVLKNMYHARKAHKLDEWREFCEWIRSLPYSELITGDEA